MSQSPRAPEPIERRMEALLRAVAAQVRPCKACGTTIALVRHRSGHLAYYTLDGVNHFDNCPEAAQSRRKTPATPAPTLFEMRPVQEYPG